MKLKKITTALSLMAASFAISAMQPIGDAELAQMTGQSGISVVTDLKLKIDELAFSNAEGTSSIKMKDIAASGLMTTRVDIVSGSGFTDSLSASLTERGVAANDTDSVLSSIHTATGYAPGSDVLQMSFPEMPTAASGALLSVSVGSTQFGNGGSLGGMAINNINMGGTRVWIYGN